MKCNKHLILVGAALMASFTFNTYAGDLPIPSLTPGATNPNVTQGNIHETICSKGYTKTIRPPVSYTNNLKIQQIREYGYEDTDPRHYEEDHLIALSIGGNPTDPKNLWPQPRGTGANADKKDELELKLMNLVCSGELPLVDAQKAMAANWIEAYKKYGGVKYNGGDSYSHKSNEHSDSDVAVRLTHSFLNRTIKELF